MAGSKFRSPFACRDLKMDNTLLDDDDPPRIKLCDFGFAKWWTQEPQMTTITGEQHQHPAAVPSLVLVAVWWCEQTM